MNGILDNESTSQVIFTSRKYLQRLQFGAVEAGVLVAVRPEHLVVRKIVRAVERLVALVQLVVTELALAHLATCSIHSRNEDC
jgi:hypothetical protein